MVSFSCEECGDVLTKKKLDQHRNRCRGATFTCIDCMVHFPGTEYRSHTACMTEEQKYQGALYKNKKAKPNPVPSPSAPKVMGHSAYVEDAPEDYEVVEFDDDNKSVRAAPPHAPSPPPAADGPVNVFDFLVANATPNASKTSLPAQNMPPPPEAEPEGNELVRYNYERDTFVDPIGYMVEDSEALVQYGTGPIPAGPNYETPAPRKKAKDSDREAKKDKKRKRLHVETDQIMTDAPPVLHSGLTGGLNRLMSRPHAFPPSPDYSGSGGEVGETPGSPLKKSKKHSKSSRTETIGNNLISMLTSGASKSKTKKRKHSSSSTSSKKHHRHHRDGKEPKLIEYRPGSGDGDKDKPEGANAMVVYKPRADLFLSFVNKGPDSERGCSVNKALKRFHRERTEAGNSLGKVMEEKELWRSLRMRRNERGEIVLFCP